MNSAEYIDELSKLPKEVAFPKAEYQRRLADVQSRMRSHSLDVLVLTFPPTLCYLSGHTTYATDKPTCLILPRKGNPTLLVPAVDITAAIIPGWVERIIPYGWHDPQDVARTAASLLEELPDRPKRIGMEFARASLTQQFLGLVRDQLREAELVDVPADVLNSRLIKSDAEIAHLREAARLTVAGLNASIASIAPGRTENEAAAAGYQAMIAGGGDYFSSQPMLCAGRRAGFVHGTFKNAVLEAGDSVTMEYGATYNRYTCPISRTAVIGKPSHAIRRVADSVLDALNSMIDSIKAGARVPDVVEGAVKAHARVPGTFFNGVYGYSVGLGVPPTWQENLFFLTEGGQGVLEEGMVLHLIPFLRVPGKLGVAFSETVVVTRDGCETFSDAIRETPVRELAIV